MADPFLGEIRMVGFNFAPVGWAFCDGQLLPIAQNTALFSLLGTIYGGNGTSTFGIPDLRGRFPIHAGGSGGPGLTQRTIGEKSGTQSETLTSAQMPAHSHVVNCHSTGGDGNNPVNKFWSKDLGSQSGTYHTSGGATMNAGALSSAGGNQAHNNMPPYLAVEFIIAMQGIYPSRP